MTCWQILASSESVTPTCHHPCTSSTLELINPWSTAITASHWLPRFLEFSSTLKLRYHQYHLNIHVKVYSLFQSLFLFSSCSCPCSDIAFLCSPCYTHHLAVFWPILWYFPFLMAMLSELYISSPLVCYSICSNINFDYCSHCLLNLWSFLTPLQLL